MAEKNTPVEPENENEEEETESPFPPEVLKRVLGLRKAHAEAEDLETAYKVERVALEQKYNALRAPVYEKRKQIIAGDIEPEFPAAEEGSGEVAEPEEPTGEKVKGIPNFWLTALAQHPVTQEIIQQEDAPALESLKDITIAYDETYNSFTLTFHFSENQYFKNATLTKKYDLTDILDEKGPQLINVEGTEIEWKDGKNLCVKEIKKKQKAKAGKNKGQIRQITKQVPTPSFFHFFAEPKSEDEEEEDEEKPEDEEEQRIQLNEEEDYEVAHAIRTNLIPDAILWFTGEAREDEDFEDDEDDEDEDEDEEDEEEGEEEEEEAPKPKGGKGGKKGKGGGPAPAAGGNAAAGGEQPECKQN